MGDILVEAKRLGRKTMAGWYDYDAKGQCPVLPQAVADAITTARRALGMGVMKRPGLTAFVRMPSGPHSWANCFVSIKSPAFATL